MDVCFGKDIRGRLSFSTTGHKVRFWINGVYFETFLFYVKELSNYG